MKIFYKETLIAEYLIADIEMLQKAITHEMIVREYIDSNNFEIFPVVAKEKPYSYQVLRYLSGILRNFETLSIHPEKIKDIYDSEYSEIQSFNQEYYGAYMSSFTEDNSVLLKDDRAFYSKHFRILELQMLYDSFVDICKNCKSILVDDSSSKKDKTRIIRQLEETTQFLEKFSKDFNTIKELQNKI